MPTSTTMVSSIKAGREQESQAGNCAGRSKIKRANAKCQKRNKSSLSLFNNPGIKDEHIGADGGVQESMVTDHQGPFFTPPPQRSREFSFGSGQSIKHFEATSNPRPRVLQKKQTKQMMHKPASGSSNALQPCTKLNNSKLSLLGARAASALHLSIFKSQKGVGAGPNTVYGLYDLPVHPSNLSQASKEMDLLQEQSPVHTPSSDADPFEDAILALENWNSIPSLAEYHSPNANPIGSSVSMSQKRSPIRDIDWSKLSDEDVRRVCNSYNHDLSPVDSGVSFGRQQDNSSPEGIARPYNGKGKSPQTSREARSDSSGSVSDSFRSFEIEVPEDISHAHPESSTLEELDRQNAHAIAMERLEGSLPSRKSPTIDDLLEEELQRWQRREQEENDWGKALELEAEEKREHEEAERQAAEFARQWLRGCLACGDSKDIFDFPAQSPTPSCDHTPATCNECLQLWMASELETKGCNGIKCPECPKTLEYSDVQMAASAKTFEAYDKLMIRNALSAFEEFAWCLSATCGSGQLNIDNNQFMDCVSCGYKQCLRHKVPWHKGETCDQYEYRTSGQQARDHEKQTEQMIDSVSKRCPGENCGWRIQKNGGCDHVTCKKCRFQFCWQCLAPQTEIRRIGNTAHAQACPYHSNNLKVSYPFNAH